MKKYLLISLLFIAVLGNAQHKIYGTTSYYFGYQSGSLPKNYYQRGKYEIFLNLFGYVGVRNVSTGVPVIAPNVFSNYRINDTAYSTVDSVILKIKQNILK